MGHLKGYVGPILLLFVVSIVPPYAFAEQKACETLEASQSYLATFDSTIENTRTEIKNNEAKRQETIDQKTKLLVANGQWKEEDQLSFFLKIVDSKGFQDLEHQKTRHLNKFQSTLPMIAVLSKQKPMGACEFATDAIASLIEIGKINAKQYSLMESSLPKAKKLEANEL